MHELVVSKTKSLVENARFISLSCDEMANSSQQSQVSIFHAYIVEDWLLCCYPCNKWLMGPLSII
jgi:hypothetical protein